MSQLSNTEHVLLPFHDQSPTQRRCCMHVCVCVCVCRCGGSSVSLPSCVCCDCLRTGTRQANQRDKVCYIAEYKCPHYGASLNVSEKELRMKDSTISERERKKQQQKTEALKRGYDKLLKKAVQRAQSHLSVWSISISTADRDRQKQKWFWYMERGIYLLI